MSDMIPHCFGSYDGKSFNCCFCTFSKKCVAETVNSELDEIEDEMMI
jgi:hypothetical protein